MLFPKKVKYRKWQTARKNPEKVGFATRGTNLSFGSFGMKAMTHGRITSNQIESARKAINKGLGKMGKIWIRIFPDRPFTEKGAEVPMGKGKGDIKGYEVEVKPGRIIFETDGVSKEKAKEAFRRGGAKMPIKVKFIVRE